MSISKQGKFTALAICAAAALTPTAAAADDSGTQVPVDVPLDGVTPYLPVDAPTISATVPSQPLTPPSVPEVMTDENVTVPLVPSFGTILDAPSALVEVPLPATDENPNAASAQLMNRSTPLRAVTPSVEVDLPITNPGTEESGMPKLTVPNATVTTPSLYGERKAGLDIVDKAGESQLPVGRLLGNVSDLVGTGTSTLKGTGVDALGN
ncbi:hypothetical protein [Streptomyces gobiensis]|uniref:hypothetical protein n=1 Tax=Streptomyces gobiensis TaxID=2875706 RepID=UPI001E4212FA|nr:hypothetical protein [Streptomyces gobiensis]UGY93178.1 hypothetical protein test1122_16625 [Streptomyces gobiensis]